MEVSRLLSVQKRDRSIITVNDSVSFVQILWVGWWFYVQFCLKLQICKCNNNIDLDSPLGCFAWGDSVKIIFSAWHREYVPSCRHGQEQFWLIMVWLWWQMLHIFNGPHMIFTRNIFFFINKKLSHSQQKMTERVHGERKRMQHL